MWFSAIKLAVNAGSHIYKKKQETRMNTCRRHKQVMQRRWLMVNWNIKQKLLKVMTMGGRMNLYSLLVSMPMLLLVWSVFSDDPEIRIKLDLFFEYFKQLPYWYQAIFIGVVSAIYGLKGADIMRKPK
jgi:hypothetical protein